MNNTMITRTSETYKNPYNNSIISFEYERRDDQFRYVSGYSASQDTKTTIHLITFYGFANGEYLYNHKMVIHAPSLKEAWKKGYSLHRKAITNKQKEFSIRL